MSRSEPLLVQVCKADRQWNTGKRRLIPDTSVRSSNDTDITETLCRRTSQEQRSLLAVSCSKKENDLWTFYAMVHGHRSRCRRSISLAGFALIRCLRSTTHPAQVEHV